MTRWLLLILGTMLIAAPAAATQHIVRAGDDWSRLSRVVRAGDEILLMPGTHVPAELSGLKGTRSRRIVIRGAARDHSAVIKATRYGLVLHDSTYVEIRDLVVDGATICGIQVSGPDGGTSSEISIRRVQVNRTGPRGQRQAIKLERLDKVNVHDCSVTGWGESGLEIVACSFVDVRGSSFTGLEDYSQISGIRVRAGTRSVQINDCSFTSTGDQGVCIGGISAAAEFLEPPSASTEPGTLFEATRVSITRSIFRGGMCAVAFVSAAQPNIQQCTIIDPEHAILSFRRETDDARYGVLKEGTFTQNIVTWPADGIARLTHVLGEVDPAGMIIRENIWWTPNWEEARERLGSWPGTANEEQQRILDPQLDAEGRPHAPDARTFGAREVESSPSEPSE